MSVFLKLRKKLEDFQRIVRKMTFLIPMGGLVFDMYSWFISSILVPIFHCFYYYNFLIFNIFHPILGSLIEIPAVLLPRGNAETLPVVKLVIGKQLGIWKSDFQFILLIFEEETYYTCEFLKLLNNSNIFFYS